MIGAVVGGKGSKKRFGPSRGRGAPINVDRAIESVLAARSKQSYAAEGKAIERLKKAESQGESIPNQYLRREVEERV
jgi:hypothetical protein